MSESISAYAAFLTARWDELETVARNPQAYEDDDALDGYFEWDARHERQPHEAKCAWRVGEGLDDECSCGYPAYVLADLAAKRAVLELHRDLTSRKDIYNRGYDEGADLSAIELRARLSANSQWRAIDDVLRLLAAPFHDHPDHPANQEA